MWLIFSVRQKPNALMTCFKAVLVLAEGEYQRKRRERKGTRMFASNALSSFDPVLSRTDDIQFRSQCHSPRGSLHCVNWLTAKHAENVAAEAAGSYQVKTTLGIPLFGGGVCTSRQ